MAWKNRVKIAGGLALGLLLAAQLGRGSASAHHPVDDDSPVRFVDSNEEATIQWDRSLVLDLDVGSEVFVTNLTTHQQSLAFATNIQRLRRGAPELRESSLRLPGSEISSMSEEQRAAIQRLSGKGPALIAERVLASVSVAGGDPRRPYVEEMWRYYRIDGEEVRPLSRKQWDQITDPVEVHLSPDGHSYRFQRGRAEPRATTKAEPMRFDTPIRGEGPMRDPLMEGKFGGRND